MLVLSSSTRCSIFLTVDQEVGMGWMNGLHFMLRGRQGHSALRKMHIEGSHAPRREIWKTACPLPGTERGRGNEYPVTFSKGGMIDFVGAWGRNRTGTVETYRGILSPLRLPLPPPRPWQDCLRIQCRSQDMRTRPLTAGRRWSAILDRSDWRRSRVASRKETDVDTPQSCTRLFPSART